MRRRCVSAGLLLLLSLTACATPRGSSATPPPTPTMTDAQIFEKINRDLVK